VPVSSKRTIQKTCRLLLQTATGADEFPKKGAMRESPPGSAVPPQQIEKGFPQTLEAFA